MSVYVVGLAVAGLVGSYLLLRARRVAGTSQPRIEPPEPEKAAEISVAPPTPSQAPEREELRQQLAYLEHFNHEIRIPITAVLGFTEMLCTPDFEPAERVNFLESIRRNGGQMLSLVNDTLCLARIEAGVFGVRHEPCRTEELVREPLVMSSPEASAKGLKIVVAAAGEIPNSVVTDPARVREILTLLLYTSIGISGSGQIGFGLRFEQSGDGGPANLVWTVSDTANEISTEVRQALFDPWSQVTVSHADVLQGAGLRLAVARRIAELVGGTVEAAPGSDGGGSWVFTLPVNVTEDAEMIAGEQLLDRRPSVPKSADVATRSLSGRVLIVEAQQEMGWLFKAVVGNRGVEVEDCGSGSDAWDVINDAESAGNPWDVIVVDMDDPSVNGSLFVQRLRLDGGKTPVIGVAGTGEEEELSRCTAAGCTIMLSKPVRGMALYDAVRSHLPKAA